MTSAMRIGRSSRAVGRTGSFGRAGWRCARLVSVAGFKSGMGCGEACDWNPKRGAGDVVEADRMTKLYGARVATMFTANPDLQLRANAPTGRYGKSNQLTNSSPVQNLERIVGKYTTIYILRKESASIVSTEAEGGLG